MMNKVSNMSDMTMNILKKVFLMLCLVLVCTVFVGVRSEKVYADIASGTCGSCSWVIDDDGVLTISPMDGVSGTLRSETRGNNLAASESWPWYSYRANVVKVVVMPGVRAASGMNHIFNDLINCISMDLSNLDTTGVTRMYGIFSDCRSLVSLDLSGFNTASVTEMRNMFSGCTKLKYLNILNFTLTSDVSRKYMFYNCGNLSEIILGPYVEILSDTELPSVARKWIRDDEAYGPYYSGAFMTSYNSSMAGRWISSIGIAVLQDNGELVFCRTRDAYNNGEFYDEVIDVNNNLYSGRVYTGVETINSSTDTRNCKWSAQRTEIKSVRVADGQVVKPINCYSWFNSCTNMTSCDLRGLDTSSVENMRDMFFGCTHLISIDLSGFDTSSVTNMYQMFCNCSKLTSVDVSNFDTSVVTNMTSMFYNCSSLTLLDVSEFDTSNVTNMSYIFYNCSSLTSLDVSEFDTANVTDMRSVFSGCYNLKSLNLNRWNTRNATNMDSMFYDCRSLSEVELGLNFSFRGKNLSASSSFAALLPTPPREVDGIAYTQKWVREDGSILAKTPKELRADYGENAAEWAGTWIWEEKQTKYTVKFIAHDGVAGAMPDQQLQADVDGTISKCECYRFNYHFDHGDGVDGRTYADEATISKNRFKVGDTLTLTAVFEKDDNHLQFTEGEATITIHGGEMVKLPNLPGGTAYQVWEETPSGWQLIDQQNPAGTISADDWSDSSFTNKYVPKTATISLMAQKTLDGRSPADGQFAFELVKVDTEENTSEVVETARNNEAGMVAFKQLVFKQPGTYTYQIREVRGDDPAISYDNHTETITINVVDDGAGNLTATKVTDGDEIPSFENETKPGSLQVVKQAEDGTGDAYFTFVINLTDDYGRPLDNVVILGGAE